MTRTTAGLALVTLAVGCGPTPRTEIMVGLATDFSALDEIDEVRLRVEKQGVTLFEQRWDLGDEELPGSIGFVPGDDPGEPFTVIADAVQGGGQRVTRQTTLTFVSGETLFVRLGLVRNCETMGCAAGQTCVEGACRRAEIDASTLPLFRPDIQNEFTCNSGTVFVRTGDGQTTTPLPSTGECDPTERCQEASCYRPPRGCRDFCAEIWDVMAPCFEGKFGRDEFEALCLEGCGCATTSCTAEELDAIDACLDGLSCETYDQVDYCLDAIPCVAEGAEVCEGEGEGYCGDYYCDAGEFPKTCPTDCGGDTYCPFGKGTGTGYCNRYNQEEYSFAGSQPCTPGQQIQIACPTCTLDPIIQIFDGEVCIASDDDSCGNYCPTTTFTCPSGGSVAVWVGPYGKDDAGYTCNWSVLSGG